MATFFDKARLLRGLLNGEGAYAGPFYVTVDLTRRCNLRCLGCRYHSPHLGFPGPGDPNTMYISFDLFEGLCKEIIAMGTKSLTLMGEGEPLLHPRRFDLISLAKASGFETTLVTNGTLLDQPTASALVDSRLDILRVSLWASSYEEYEKNYPGTNPQYFDKVLEGLKLLSRLKATRSVNLPFVVLHQPVNRHNFQRIEAMVDLAHETRCDAVSFSPHLSHRRTLNQFALSPEEENHLCLALARLKDRLKLLSIRHRIDDTLLRYRIGEAVWGKFPCYIGWLHARIKVDGTVLPCGPWSKPLGHVGRDCFRDIWNGPGYRAFRRLTLTRKGLRSIQKDCDCSFCCLIRDNIRVHRFFGYFSPFLIRSKIGLPSSTLEMDKDEPSL